MVHYSAARRWLSPSSSACLVVVVPVVVHMHGDLNQFMVVTGVVTPHTRMHFE
jgi:hypothetical protein